jgi:type I restriction enzyme S subunit
MISATSGSQWKRVPLGSIAKFRNGINYSKSNFGTGIKVINVKDFQDRTIIPVEDLDEINPVGVVSKESFLQNGDIIFVRSNGNRQLIGRSLFVNGVQEKITHSAFTIRVRFTSGLAIPRFYSYLFRSPFMRQILSSQGSGTNINNLNQRILEDLQVPLPPLFTQRKIAAILSAYDDLIENNTRRIKILEEMAQALYREWFVRFRFPGHENVRMVDSPLGRMPEGWEVKRLGDIAQEVRRIVKPDQIDPETPYFGLEHLPRKSIALSEWDMAKNVLSTKLIFKRGEILFGKIRPYFHKVGVAPVDGICSSDTIIIAPKSPECFSIILSCVSSEDFVKHATQTSKGTKMPRADWDVLANYRIAVPKSNILTIFNNFIIDIVLQIRNIIFQNRNLRVTRDLLLFELFSKDGEVGVLLGEDYLYE